MKNYKRVLGFALLLSLVLSLALVTGCGKKTPKDKFSAAQSNMQKAKDVKFDEGKLTANLDLGGQKVEINADLAGQFIKSTTDDPTDFQGAFAFSMNFMGQKSTVNAYVKDKTTYSDNGQIKTKTKLSMTKEDFEKSFGAEPVKLDEFIKEEKEDGNKITLKLDGKKYMAESIKKWGDAEKDAKSLKEITDSLKKMNIGEITVIATIEKEQFKAFKYIIPMEMDGEALGAKGQKVKVDLTIDLPKITVDSGAKIDFPDFKDYK